MSEIYSQHHNQTHTPTPNQTQTPNSHRGPPHTTSYKKLDPNHSNSKTTAANSKNPTNSLQNSTKKTFNPKHPKQPKQAKQGQIHSLVNRDGEVYMVLTNGDYIGPLKLSDRQLNACASKLFLGENFRWYWEAGGTL